MAAPRRAVIFGTKACCLCASTPFRSTKAANRWTRNLTTQRHLASVASLSADVKLDEAVEKQLQKGETKPRQHPGVLNVKSVALPDSLENAIKLLVDKYPTLRLVQNADKFCRYLKCRLPPVEEDVLRQTAVRLEDEIRKKEVGTRNLADLGSDELKKIESNVKGKVLKQLREQVYHWESIEYTTYKGFLYMVGKMDQDYAVLTRCLRELRRRDPRFSPSSVFDFGSGVGSAVWAVNSLWGNAVSEYYCVDKSGEMNTLARLLLQEGEDEKEALIPGVYFRQFHPSTQNRFDLTISTFTLLEFPTQSERLQAVQNLWEMTDDCMVLVENGSYAGYKLIQEAREFVLTLGGSLQGHVFSPCPHDEVCPKLSWSKKSACTTEVKSRKLQMSSNTYVYERVGFSYVILRKGSRNTELLGHEWPRMVKQTSRPHGHTPCTVCCADGTIQTLVLTKAKHSKDLYTCSRYCKMGDLLPVSLPGRQDGGQVSGFRDKQTEISQDRTIESERRAAEVPLHPTETSFV